MRLLSTDKKTIIDETRSRRREHLYFFFVCFLIIVIFGCSQNFQARSLFKEGNDLFNQADHKASLNRYEQILEKYPAAGDRALFEMGIIYADSRNEQKDFRKSLECFQKVIKDYPESGYRKDSEMMTFHLNNITVKEKTIATQQEQIETLRQTQIETLQQKDKKIAVQQQQIDRLEQQLKVKGDEIATLQKKIETLEQKVFAIQRRPADKILIEKKERRLTLISKGEVLKTYKIALGGNPNGPKERQGDNKTPEGIYSIDSRNKDSRFHRSLHISYPNEKDRRRAKELGVSPGGGIMIHGIKEGFSWAGDLHTEVDWTKGCIAVTDEEIEEIEKLVPNGTIVEIRP